MDSVLRESVVRIISAKPENRNFGTAFIIHRDRETTYLLTCAHVVRDVGGAESMRITELPATVIAIGNDENGPDLAVVTVKGLSDRPVLKLSAVGEKGRAFITSGFREFDKSQHLLRDLNGTLGDKISLEPRTGAVRVAVWDLIIEGDNTLERGYSGAPLADKESIHILAVVSHGQKGGSQGFAISVEALAEIWRDMPASLLSESHSLIRPVVRNEPRMNLDEELAVFEEIVTGKFNKLTFTRRGETHRVMGNYPAALADFDRAIALNDKDALAIARRGETHRLMENHPAALADFDRAIALNDKDAWAIARRGETCRLMGNNAAALADFDRAIALEKTFAWVIASRGETYRLMGNYPAALEDFDRAVALDDKHAWAIARRGETYRLMENYRAALADLDQATILEPEKDWVYYQRGLISLITEGDHCALEQFAEAIRLAKSSDGENPDHWRTTINLALYHLAKGDPESAGPLYSKAIGGPPSILFYFLEVLKMSHTVHRSYSPVAHAPEPETTVRRGLPFRLTRVASIRSTLCRFIIGLPPMPRGNSHVAANSSRCGKTGASICRTLSRGRRFH